ncbi:MAG: hypothetical protein ACRC4W_04990 [Treponemataceae bacterium]
MMENILGILTLIMSFMSSVLLLLTLQSTRMQNENNNVIAIWKESLVIFTKINESNSTKKNKKATNLKYFELFIYFERACAFFYTLRYKNSKKQFYSLFDDTIEANLRKHLHEALNELYSFKQKRTLIEYGYKNLAYYIEDFHKEKRNVNHQICNEGSFKFDEIFWAKLKRYNKNEIEKCKSQHRMYKDGYKKRRAFAGYFSWTA